VVYPPTGSTANDREMSTHAYARSGRGIIYLFRCPNRIVRDADTSLNCDVDDPALMNIAAYRHDRRDGCTESVQWNNATYI